MATPDHTERSRPSPSTDPHPTPILGRTRRRKADVEKTQLRRAATLAGIAVAHQAVARLLDHAHAYHDDRLHDGAHQSEQLDVLIKTVRGLFTATYFLNQYAGTLLRQPSD